MGNAAQSLVLNVSFGGGYDNNVLIVPSEDEVPVPTLGRRESRLGFATVGLSYSLEKGSFGAFAGVNGAGTYYPSLSDDVNTYYTASAGVTWRRPLTQRMTIGLGESVILSPFYNFTGIESLTGVSVEGGPQQTPFELGTELNSRLNSRANIDLSYQLTRRITAGVGVNQLDTFTLDGERELTSAAGTAGLGFQITRNLNLRLGYRYNTAKYAETDLRTSSHSADIGLGFNRGFTFALTRKTRLTLGGGIEAIRGLTLDDKIQFVVTGDATLTREIGRSWRAAVNYGRGVSFDQAFQRPVLRDTAGASLTGMFNRRLSFRSGARALFGQVGPDTPGNRITGYSAAAGLGFALSRMVQLGVDYGYAEYELGETVVLPEGVSRQADRHSVRAYVSTFLPIFTRTRRPNAAR